jgi:hypothetical protein
MTKLSDLAFDEILTEIKAGCRLPIDEAALETVIGRLRVNFERHLDDHPAGWKRWGDSGQRVRNYARHLGAFADFFAGHVGATVVGADELTSAFKIIRADCTIQASITPFAMEFCCEEGYCNDASDSAAADFLESLAPSRPRLARAG